MQETRKGRALFAPLAAMLAIAYPAFPAAAASMPQRVVSMNLCTDQMAMLIAAPGQLYSVSFLAADPISSVLAPQAGRYAVNHGQAEEIFLMQPDLVLAGTYTTGATVDLLRRLGIRVEQFAPENSFDDIRASLRRMGDVLGQPQRAEELVADLDRRLAAVKVGDHAGMTAAIYYANSYTSGSGTLIDDVMTKAGLVNIATKFGFAGMERLPLELLVLSDPDLLVTADRDYSAPALAQQGFEHPAFRAQAALSGAVDLASRYTICGAPFTIEAVRLLSEGADARKASPK